MRRMRRMQPPKPASGKGLKAHLCILMLALFSVCTPSLATADVAPAAGGCDCNQAPGEPGQKPVSAEAPGKRRFGIVVFAGLVAGAFLYSARRVRHKNPRR
jgi:hypothetical protein